MRSFRFVIVLAIFTLLLSGLPPRQAEANTASAKTKQNTNVKANNTARQKRAAPAKTRENSSTRTSARFAKPQSSDSSGQASKKRSSRKQNFTDSNATSAAKKKSGRKARWSRNSSASLRAPYKGAVVFNASTGQVIFSRNPNTQVPPASLTKILSMFVAEDAIRARKINPNTLVTVSPRAAAARGSRMGLSAYDKVPLEDLLHGMAVSSGNDASIAVAEYIGGSEKKFVQMMNQKARSLGMTRSTFANANGLPAPGQYTTAKDMLTLSRAYLAAYPGNLQKHHKQIFNSYRGNMTANANPLLRAFHGADGLKTGFVNAAGYNLIATAQRDGQRVIGVVLGAPSSAVRANEACSLMEACFSTPATLTAQSTPADLAAVSGKTLAKGQKETKETLRTADADAPALKARSGKKSPEKGKTGASSKKGKRTTGSPAKNTADKTPKTRTVS